MILVIEVERPTVRHPNDLRVGCQCSAIKSAPDNNDYPNGAPDDDDYHYNNGDDDHYYHNDDDEIKHFLSAVWALR